MWLTDLVSNSWNEGGTLPSVPGIWMGGQRYLGPSWSVGVGLLGKMCRRCLVGVVRRSAAGNHHRREPAVAGVAPGAVPWAKLAPFRSERGSDNSCSLRLLLASCASQCNP
jgi:hypothetical protein